MRSTTAGRASPRPAHVDDGTLSQTPSQSNQYVCMYVCRSFLIGHIRMDNRQPRGVTWDQIRPARRPTRVDWKFQTGMLISKFDAAVISDTNCVPQLPLRSSSRCRRSAGSRCRSAERQQRVANRALPHRYHLGLCRC
jgi:hypothetical protein